MLAVETIVKVTKSLCQIEKDVIDSSWGESTFNVQCRAYFIICVFPRSLTEFRVRASFTEIVIEHLSEFQFYLLLLIWF